MGRRRVVDDDEDDEDEEEDEDEERGEAMSPFQQGTRLRRLLNVVEHTGQAFQEMKWKHMLGAWAPLGRVLDARSGQVLEGGNNLVAFCTLEAISVEMPVCGRYGRRASRRRVGIRFFPGSLGLRDRIKYQGLNGSSPPPPRDARGSNRVRHDWVSPDGGAGAGRAGLGWAGFAQLGVM